MSFVLDVSSSALSHCDFVAYPAIVKVTILISPLGLFLPPSCPLQSVLDSRKVGAAEGGTEVETAGEHPTVATHQRDTDLKGNIYNQLILPHSASVMFQS